MTRASIFCSPASNIFMVLALLNHNFDIIMLDRCLLQLGFWGMRLMELFSLLLLLSGYIGDLIVQIINIASFRVVIEITSVARRHELTLGVGLLVELFGYITSFFAFSFLFWCLVLQIFVLLRWLAVLFGHNIFALLNELVSPSSVEVELEVDLIPKTINIHFNHLLFGIKISWLELKVFGFWYLIYRGELDVWAYSGSSIDCVLVEDWAFRSSCDLQIFIQQLKPACRLVQLEFNLFHQHLIRKIDRHLYHRPFFNAGTLAFLDHHRIVGKWRLDSIITKRKDVLISLYLNVFAIY